ncbi:hypothetical protein LCGC14_1200360 [marine sediment metagenome]|uniref:Uncharacterized protein n=1 Tax=marine sediment metagenome TaxID=412755 RepID=A0A0F9LH35_9ZZZZ|nr:hypothetical protein [Candidatus Aminicenantes bacterium]
MTIDFNKSAGANRESVTPKTGSAEWFNALGLKPTLPTTINPFDIEPAKAELSVHEEAIKEMVAKSRAFKITDDESNSMAVQMGLQAKKLAKRIKEAGADKTKEHRLFTGAVRNLVKVYTDMLEDIETGLKGKFRVYSRLKEIKQKEDERKLQEANRKLQAEIDRDAKKKKIDPVQLPEVALPQKQAPTRTEKGSASIRKKWTWDKETYDFSKIPDEYKMIDGPAISKAIKAAVRNIPGIRIFQDDVPVWRT